MRRDHREPSPDSPDSPEPRDDEVGYGKPPKKFQFKRGESGNPTGRPPGSKNRPAAPAAYDEPLKALIREEAYRPITITDEAQARRMPIIQVALRSAFVNAAKGKARAQELLLRIVAAIERQDRKEAEETLRFWLKYKDDWARRPVGKPPIPHPDDVHIDIVQGTVTFSGPVTRDQKKIANQLPDYIPVFEADLKALKFKRDDPSCRNKMRILKKIDKTERVLAFLRGPLRKK